MDLEKVYDYIKLSLLLAKAEQLEYPAVERFMGALMYLARVVARASGACELPLSPFNSIVAGGASAATLPSGSNVARGPPRGGPI